MDDRIERKIDKIADHIGNIDVTLAKQEVTLADHIRRTELLEEKMSPVEKHVNMVHGVLKAIAAIGTIVGIVHGILKLKGL
jgi:hypothetical protein